MTLQGKRVLVVGGSSGIGLATARFARERGAAVTIASRSSAKLTEAATEIGGGVQTRVVDVTDDASVAALMTDLGTLDHVVYTPPGATVGTVRDLDIEAAREGLNAKFWGGVRTAKYARITPDGSLTFISGQMARRPRPGLLTGGCANAALEALARGLAIEMAPVRVNVISPGFIDTPLHARLSDEVRARAYDEAKSRLPVGRPGNAREIASMIVEVMGNGFVTGTIIQVDGGANALL